MRRTLVIMVLFVAVLTVPFVLRPHQQGFVGDHDNLVIITPHNGALRYEFDRGFSTWYQQKTGRTVAIDWRAIGGTSEITRYLEGEYTTSFQHLWTQSLHRAWSGEIQAGFQNASLPAQTSADVRAAREEFLKSDASCGIDLFFGGGTYDFIHQAQIGTLVDSGILQKHPEWFHDEVIPHDFAGEDYWDRHGLWIGTVLSSYGLLSNRDVLAQRGVSLPQQWTDLENGKLMGTVALADPSKSSSMAKVFENIIQQQMQRRLLELAKRQPTLSKMEREAQAVAAGWLDGLRVIQLIGANAGYFTDNSQKPPIDVAAGDFGIGLCIDFYGRQQQEAVERRGHSDRLSYISPAGGSIASVDPIGLLRGAPHREIASLFIEYVLTMEGQKLWNFRVGTPGGPERYPLRRLPVRRDFYGHTEFKPYLTDPEDAPYAENADRLIYHPAWTAKYFREMSFVIRVMCLDTHDELVRARRAILEAGGPPEALARLQDLSAVDYEQTTHWIHQQLTSKDKTDEVKIGQTLGQHFRQQYGEAERLARELGKKTTASSP